MMPESAFQTTQKRIKTFAYQSLQSFHKSYKWWLTTYRDKKDLWDIIKVCGIFSLMIMFLIAYLYFINLSSTRGFFMRMAQEELNTANAQSDIIKLEIVKEKRENWNNLTVPKDFSLKKNVYILEINELTPQ